MKMKSEQKQDVSFNLQDKHENYFRVIKQGVAHKLAGTGLVQQQSKVFKQLTDDQKVEVV